MDNVKTKNEKSGGAFSVLQRVGRAFMLPIALLPIAGLLLGIGASLTNATMIQTYRLENILGEGTALNFILTIMSETGSAVFNNLAIIFAVGVALGMAENERGTAALSAMIAFIIMHTTISAMLDLTGTLDTDLPEGSIASVVGIRSLEMGVFGGIIVGLGVAWLHNRFYKIKLPAVLSFFGGVRFVPIISTVAYIAVGAAMFYVWPLVQRGIFSLGNFVLESGYFGTFVYGFIERALIPFGLHHVFYLPFWQTGLGGSAMIDGNLVYGAQNIFFAELASSGVTEFSSSATRFMSGKFPMMIFGLPGAALAMYTVAKPEKKKTAGGLLLSAALTAMITGITEPLEFTFLFVAPLMYIVHCVFSGLAYMFMHMLNVGVGMTFSGGIIDLLLFGVIQGSSKTHWVNIIWVGLIYFVVYFGVFAVMIKYFNYATPGRETEGETKLYTRADYNKKKKGDNGGSEINSEPVPLRIIRALGGRENIKNLDACATRLRVTVDDGVLVDENALKNTGAAGVIRRGNGIQVIYGPIVTNIKSELEEYLSSSDKKSSESES
ncbi:MAG: PTS transporter subunit EIIC [Eubacteriales bacterium]